MRAPAGAHSIFLAALLFCCTLETIKEKKERKNGARGREAPERYSSTSRNGGVSESAKTLNRNPFLASQPIEMRFQALSAKRLELHGIGTVFRTQTKPGRTPSQVSAQRMDEELRLRMQELLASAATRRRATAQRDGRNPWCPRRLALQRSKQLHVYFSACAWSDKCYSVEQ